MQTGLLPRNRVELEQRNLRADLLEMTLMGQSHPLHEGFELCSTTSSHGGVNLILSS